MPSSGFNFFRRFAPLYGPHYGVAGQGMLRGLGLVYVLSFWSVAAQIAPLSGPAGLQPAGEFLSYLRDQHGAWAPLLYPGLGWVSQSPLWLLGVAGAGALAGLGMLYGLCPGVGAGLAWVCWVSLLQCCQPWLSTSGDFLLAEAGLLALFLAPVLRLHYPRMDEQASRLTGVLLLNLLLIKVIFTTGLARLADPESLWARGTAFFHYFETQPLPTAAAWYLHHLPSTILKYLLWGLLFIELMLPWYAFLPRTFRNIFAGGVAVKAGVMMATGQHGPLPLLLGLLAFGLVDDVTWRRLLPSTWGPPAFSSRYQPGWAALIMLLMFVPLLAFQTLGGARFAVPVPWRWPERVLSHLHASNLYGRETEVRTSRFELALQGSPDGRNWLEYRFWMKPTDPRALSPVGMLHAPRLDLAFSEAADRPAVQRGRLPGWMLRLIRNLLAGDAATASLFPVNPFPETPPRYLRLVFYEYQFADPVTHRERNLWWRRRVVRQVGPVFSRQANP